MKKLFFLITISAAILFNSCKKELDQTPISASTTATFYRSPSDFLQASNAIYASLHNYPIRLSNLSEIRSDNIYGVSVTVRDWDPINDFSPSIAANSYVTEAWSTDFNGIFRANTLLDQIDKNGSFIESATLATRLQAEAKFLRAFYYFDLVRYFGKVPIIDHPVSAPEAATINRANVVDVYKFMIADLQSAITNLPPTYTGVDVGRATKYAAEALLAQVYMAKSSAKYGIDGPGQDSNEWNLALPLLQDIISSGLYVFNTNYSNIFSYTNQSPTVNKEAVFNVMYQTGISGTADLYGASFPWVLAPGAYFLSLKDSRSNGSLEIIPVSNDLLNSYASADVRKAFNINTAGYTNAGSTENRPFFKKWLDITKIPTTSRFDWGINFIAFRYTDILMLKAECILRGAPGAQADVDAIVNQVRIRAGLTAITGVTLPQLFEERRKEFANEGSRWFDLQRSGDLLNIMNAWRAKDDAQNAIRPATANHIIYPVPQTQIDAVPGLYIQNPGY
ncbi:RagB/SusD family nutrient uptake outer membrane protein [Pedobacter mucosus]|uniref:RagB/SusD family nutrient uptake outer membrane protein n=1 Tax=Pedobacter mucosus TaxID=2895286 RepID=UPI001EE3E2F3|nr:RagB/SusD family nutrient uptake outer membrane protein [Pedobacter mucosus]UKT62824.1 RagB/SusD family nutrient uptake outer membrane protein [Pedobacter mucosus]